MIQQSWKYTEKSPVLQEDLPDSHPNKGLVVYQFESSFQPNYILGRDDLQQ